MTILRNIDYLIYKLLHDEFAKKLHVNELIEYSLDPTLDPHWCYANTFDLVVKKNNKIDNNKKFKLNYLIDIFNKLII